MLRNIYAISLALSIGLWIGISGCTKQPVVTSTRTEIPTVPTPVATPIPTVNPLTENDKASKFVDSYLKEVTTAGDGSVYYCKPDDIFTFYSPRKYEILRIQPAKEKSMLVTTRMESSNSDGVSIVKDWWVILLKQKPDSTTLPKEVSEYGYCIRMVSEKL